MRAAVACLLLVLMAGTCPAAPTRPPASDGAASAATDVYDYAPGSIYPVRTALGITTQVVLDPNERVLDFSSGFSNGWDLVRRDNVFYLRPRDVDVDTNLVVRTETATYLFELRVVATDWNRLEDARRAGAQYRIVFAYPPGHAFAAPVAAAGDAVGAGEATGPSIALGIDPARAYHFDYDVAAARADAWLLPLSVHDDGDFTYVRLADRQALPSGNFPAVFGREREDGEDYLVNTTVRGAVLVVHGIHPYLVLRHGRQVLGLRRRGG